MNLDQITQSTNYILLSNQKFMNEFDFDFLYSKIKSGIISEDIAKLLTTTPREVLLKLKFKLSSEDYSSFSILLEKRAKNFDWALSECFDYRDSLIAKNYYKAASRLESITSNWII